MNHTRTICKYAISSRILLLTLIILWRSLLSPYDTSASINPNCLSDSSRSTKPPILFPSIASAIEESIVWDSVFFVRIAECGYEYEQSYAFFPLFPILIFLLSNSVFLPLISVIGYRAVLGLSGYVISNVAFVFAALSLYRLSVVILKDRNASLCASILFCFNPASIFYSSIYSESLYALLSIGGMHLLMSGVNNVPALLFALSGSARSNGVLNGGYYGFKALHQSYYAMYVKKRANILFAGALRCICVFIPFLAFQAYGYYNICHGRNPDEMRPWCKAKIPLLYGFIQSHYWGVGFLQYFQFKQLPNFLLASPVLSLAICSIISYLKADPENFFSLGFRAALKKNNAASFLFSREEEPVEDDNHSAANEEPTNVRRRPKSVTVERSAFPKENQVSVKSGYYSASVIPYIIHLSFMAATAFFVMHVQVATRFLSASPPLYWFASCLMTSCGKSWRWAQLIWAYAALYILLGSLLFSNFYPFT
ncbi:GPI mannosyltransferase 2-like isoform X2 [Chenopodium quinoa]|uniref:GPI mannosyltransferase 2-like isoform X2 n=1 Tax=Chenopodium quinoa TaxID=63459 RepID=UPI000B795263|nr:GPI mannosyltransferase 2-like isoform X2 [Chenopodium quinoa]